VTSYVVPVPGENITANNFAMKIVTVRFVKYVLWDDVHDGDGDSLTGNYLSLYQLLSSSGFVVHELTSGTINSGVLAPYDILVLIDPEYDFLSSEISDIHDWVTSGGALIVIPDAGYPPTLNTIMALYGIQLTGLDTGYGTTTNIIAHPITQNVGSIYYDRAWQLAVSSPSEALAWTLEYYAFLSATTGGEVVVISDSNIMDNDGLGMANNTQLMLNMFNWIGVRYEHDLAVSLEAPTFLEPDESSLINATVHNRGLSNETDVELQLFINGTEVESVVIPELLSGSSHTLSYLWTPIIEGTYNVTAYAPPVPDENVTANNFVSKMVRVRYVTVALISDQSQLLAMTPILDSMSVGYDIYNDNSIYLYTEDLDLLLSYKIVIFNNDNRGITSGEHSALQSYLSSGGNLLVTGYDSLGHPEDWLLADIIRSSSVGDNVGEPDLYVVDAMHPIMNGPYGSFPTGYHISGLYGDCDAVEADTGRNAVTVAQLADGYDKIIATEGLPGKVVYWNGRGDYDWTTNVDCEAMFKNMLIWLITPVLPVASFTWTPSIPKVGESVTFDASASTPNGGIILKYEWNFGDGETATGKVVSHTYADPGTYTVTLNVTDSEGLSDIEQKQIQVVQPHGPEAEFTWTPTSPRTDESIKFDASASQPGWNGTHTMPITEYRWDFGDGNKTTTSTPIVYHSYKTAGNYVTLTVYAPGATPETDTITHRVTVISVPVGGYSFPIQVQTKTEPIITYIASLTIITMLFTKIKQKTKRKRISIG
jgi:PKD repeat protein